MDKEQEEREEQRLFLVEVTEIASQISRLLAYHSVNPVVAEIACLIVASISMGARNVPLDNASHVGAAKEFWERGNNELRNGGNTVQ